MIIARKYFILDFLELPSLFCSVHAMENLTRSSTKSRLSVFVPEDQIDRDVE